MKLSNLEIGSTMRITQPDTDDAGQIMDIEFDVTRGATILTDLYELAFYGMLNGYVTGVNGGSANCGFKFVGYDKDGTIVMESGEVKLDRVVDETNTKLIATTETVVSDMTTDVYITKLDIEYVSNDADAGSDNAIMTSNSPAMCAFAEAIPATAPVLNGVLITGGMDTRFTGSFEIS